MEFSRPEYWSGLPFPSPWDLPNPGIKPTSLMSPALAGNLYHCATWEVQCGVCIHTHTHIYIHIYNVLLLSGDLIQYDRWVAYKQQKFITHSLGDWESEIREPGWMGEDPLPGCRLLIVSSHGRES